MGNFLDGLKTLGIVIIISAAIMASSLLAAVFTIYVIGRVIYESLIESRDQEDQSDTHAD